MTDEEFKQSAMELAGIDEAEFERRKKILEADGVPLNRPRPIVHLSKDEVAEAMGGPNPIGIQAYARQKLNRLKQKEIE